MQETDLRGSLAAAYNYFHALNHKSNVNKIKELAYKLKSGEYGIAFAGHFSAGKSRMINNLLGENILPSSPIPTSANLVKVHRGKADEDYARVFFHKEKPRKYLSPYDYDLLRSFCKDGDQIAEIELCRSDLELPEQVMIMDTPGIDSADDAHRAATEAALHLADVILYVMDYNHVQADLNLSFTRDLTMAGKEVYLLVNQIDKHVESELSFESFCSGLEKAFFDWGVRPAGFFYTSLKYAEHPHNQFAALKQMLEDRIAKRKELLSASIEASLRKIFQEYVQEVQEKCQSELEASKAVLAKLSEDRLQQLKHDYSRLNTELEKLTASWEDDFDAGMQRILDNAYLMPTSTRDLARDYLEACQPDFKVGLFTRGKKTMAELERRKRVFFADASEKAQSQLEWHIKTYFTDFARKHHADSQELTGYIEKVAVQPPEKLLTDAMRSGAKLTQDGSYVMNYTENFAEGTKAVARRKGIEYKAMLQDLLCVRTEERTKEVRSQLQAMEVYHRAWAAVDEAAAEVKSAAAEADRLMQTVKLPANWEEVFVREPLDEEIVAPLTTEQVELAVPAEKQKSLSQGAAVQPKAQSEPIVEATSIQSAKDDLSGKAALKHWSKKLSTAADILGTVPALQQLSGELAERAQRLDNKGFMVTLFGAFSAGKSSFANSLLGEALLPVSPNPTTAAINKICPVDAEHPHGTVIVKLKDEEMLLADVNRALSVFELKAQSCAEVIVLAEIAMADTSNDRQREKAFLRALVTGFAAAEPNLGKEVACTLPDFALYAAQEDKSCFVDWLEVYYDCEFTRLGITLVDTPGADSINARHTNMSFNYIRQSDVVLFVTYYNHAFGKADREFLIQLGRVKDAFALDKMFFIVNAIDLAENDEEAQGVISYVASQLKKYGVKKPQMFGLSSKQILAEKLAGKMTGFEFEMAFYRFVLEELTNIAVNAAAGEYELAGARVTELIALAQGSESDKEKRKAQILSNQSEAHKVLAGVSSQEMQNKQKQELHELVYYVKQRVFLRYTDFYREAFNPAVFKDKDNAKAKLHHALEELLQSMGFDFAQELRATTLRLEQFLIHQSVMLQQSINGKLLEISSELPISIHEGIYEAKLDFADAFADASLDTFAAALRIYKNPKSFFEQGGAKEMAAEIEKLLQPLADEYLYKQEAVMLDNFTAGTECVYNEVVERFQKRLAEGFAADFAALEGGVPIEALVDIKKQLA